MTELLNKIITCNDETKIYVDNSYYKQYIQYCYVESNEEIQLKITIPLSKYDCYSTCLDCHEPGNNDDHLCDICDNGRGYYFKQDDDKKNCYTGTTIDEGYYLDSSDKIYKKCSNRCKRCNGYGDDYQSNCAECNDNFHFAPFREFHCIQFNELADPSYYVNENNHFTKCSDGCYKCNSSDSCTVEKKDNGAYNDAVSCDSGCLSCEGNSAHCTKCNNDDNFHFDLDQEHTCTQIIDFNSTNYFLDTELDKIKRCHDACQTCDGPYPNNCILCSDGYYHKEDDNIGCFNNDSIGQGYYFDTDIYKKCYISCKTCVIGGDGTNNNCIKCIDNYHFDSNIDGNCITKSIGYYVDENDKYQQCYERCKTCDGPNANNCLSCSSSSIYYYLDENQCLSESDLLTNYYFDNTTGLYYRCSDNCETCSTGFDYTTGEMNCITCKEGTYFENSDSTNCIQRKDGFYINNDHTTLLPCHINCATCDEGAVIGNNNCLSCISSLYFDYYVDSTNCVDDDTYCNDYSCGKCLIEDHSKCRKCSHKKGYYQLEKIDQDQLIVECYNSTPKNFFFYKPEKIYRLCYKTCEYCYDFGNDANHSCSSCDFDFRFVDEKPFNCYPKCNYNYYFANGQYKCTDKNECPNAYPYYIKEKAICTDNCYKYNMVSLGDDCLSDCPTGTYVKNDTNNKGEETRKCIDPTGKLNENECQLDEDSNKNKDDINEDFYKQLADDYIDKYQNQINHVERYSYISSETSDKVVIILYKSEKCAIRTIENFISLDLDECIEKVKQQYQIENNVVVELIYKGKDHKYYLYHPETKEQLDTTICLNVRPPSIFDNKDIDEEAVRYFASLGINLFDLNDPFFVNICFPFSKDGKDYPLSYRIKLFYQNVSLCEENCVLESVDLETFQKKCECNSTTTESGIGALIGEYLDNPFSSEILGFITESNVDTLKCIREAFNIEYFYHNYGGIMMISFIGVQIIASFIYFFQTKSFERQVFQIINEVSIPPLRKKGKGKQKKEDDDNENKNKYNITQKDNYFFNDEDNIEHNYLETEDLKKQKVISSQKGKKQKKNKILKIKHINNNTDDNSNRSANINVIADSSRVKLDKSDSSLNIESKKKKQKANTRRYRTNNKALNKTYHKTYAEKNNNNNKTIVNPYFSRPKLNKNSEGYVIKLLRSALKKEIAFDYRKEQQMKRLEKELVVEYQSKEFDEKDINELYFENAIIYDKRNFCQIFWYNLKSRQTIINTFCVREPLKLFSMKLLILSFSFSCYFAINGFAFNDEYIGQKLIDDGGEKGLLDYISDYFTRIIYTSVVGSLIDFMKELIFSTAEKLETIIERNKNNKVLLKGEIYKTFKYNKIVIVCFIFLQLCVSIFFVLYVLCFCYVYPNNYLDWFGSSIIIIGFFQSFPFLGSFLIAITKFYGLRCQSELCFNLNEYLAEQL